MLTKIIKEEIAQIVKEQEDEWGVPAVPSVQDIRKKGMEAAGSCGAGEVYVQLYGPDERAIPGTGKCMSETKAEEETTKDPDKKIVDPETGQAVEDPARVPKGKQAIPPKEEAAVKQ